MSTRGRRVATRRTVVEESDDEVVEKQGPGEEPSTQLKRRGRPPKDGPTISSPDEAPPKPRGRRKAIPEPKVEEVEEVVVEEDVAMENGDVMEVEPTAVETVTPVKRPPRQSTTTTQVATPPETPAKPKTPIKAALQPPETPK